MVKLRGVLFDVLPGESIFYYNLAHGVGTRSWCGKNSRDDEGTTSGHPFRDGRNIWDGADGAVPVTALSAVRCRASQRPGHGGRTPWAASAAAARRVRDAGGARDGDGRRCGAARAANRRSPKRRNGRYRIIYLLFFFMKNAYPHICQAG